MVGHSVCYLNEGVVGGLTAVGKNVMAIRSEVMCYMDNHLRSMKTQDEKVDDEVGGSVVDVEAIPIPMANV